MAHRHRPAAQLNPRRLVVPTTILPLLLLAALLVLSLQHHPALAQEENNASDSSSSFYCPASFPILSDDALTNNVYRVGVLAIRGKEAAYKEFNKTFGEYLSLAAGARFDPPLRFEPRALDFASLFTDTEDGLVDFLYVNPSAYSCLESEFGAQSLVSQVSRRLVGGQSHDLTRFGGVIATLRNNTQINRVQDLKGKIVAAASISGLGSGQMQFRKLQDAGLSFINDPKQLVLAQNQNRVVRGLLNGDFDVGFVRTDQLERTKDAQGNLRDVASTFKVIDPQPNLMDSEGHPFPFQSSTQLYPEWNLAALPHVPDDVSSSVQEALKALSHHARAGKKLEECQQDSNQTYCGSLAFPQAFDGHARCDTTTKIATVAHQAMVNGKYAGWRTTLSYMELRSMQETTGFIRFNETSRTWKCARSKDIYEAIVCPKGTFRTTQQEVERKCRDRGLDCKQGYRCICSPCHKGFEVDVFQIPAEEALSSDRRDYYYGHKEEGQQQVAGMEMPAGHTTTEHDEESTMSEQEHSNHNQEDHAGHSGHERGLQHAGHHGHGADHGGGHYENGCHKMSICGTTVLYEPIVFRIIDHLERKDARITILVHEGDNDYTVRCSFFGQIDGSHGLVHEFSLPAEEVGIATLEVFLNGEQIQESPLRVRVALPDCEDLYGFHYESNPDGECVCKGQYVTLGGSCLSYLILLPSIFLPFLVLVVVISLLYVHQKKIEADSIWTVNPRELQFPEVPVILGHGTFGVVLLANFHGTDVAVKKVLPPRQQYQSEATRTRESVDTDSMFRGMNSFQSITSSILPTIQERLAQESVDQERVGQVVVGMSHPGSEDFGTVSGYRVGSRSHGYLSDLNLEHTADNSSSDNNHNSFLCFGSKKDRYERLKSDFIQEMRLLSKLRHPCITTVMGAIVHGANEPLLVMEHMSHGSLYDLLHNDTMYIDGEILLPIMRDIAQGLRFLHSAEPQVIHGDIKTKNILVSQVFRAKVADFGLSQKRRNAKAIGTPYWMAPELLRGEGGNTTASDIYSISICLFEMYARKTPYEGLNTPQVLKLVCDPLVNKRPLIPNSCPPEIASLMKACWKANPYHRPTAEDLDDKLKMLTVEQAEPIQRNNSRRRRKRPSTQSLFDGSETNYARRQQKLHQIFPPKVAQALMRGDKVEPEHHNCVTLVLVNIVDFFKIASGFPPSKLSNLLDRLYQALDEVVQRHELFRLETVKEGYMAVGNLQAEQHDHAKRVASFAVGAVQAASTIPIDEEDPSKGTIQLRLGVHTGPVVANVVGTSNPRYSLFGDSINTVSKVERNSAPEKILCSANSAMLLLDQAPDGFELTRRKEGKADTYWVSSPNKIPEDTA